MEDLKAKKLDSWLKNTRKPVLGICLGMQLLYESSEEGETTLLGILPGRLRKFDTGTAKVPHMGWNRTWPCGGSTGPSDSSPEHSSKNSTVRDRTNTDVSAGAAGEDRKSTRLNSSHVAISYAVFCLKKNNKKVV